MTRRLAVTLTLCCLLALVGATPAATSTCEAAPGSQRFVDQSPIAFVGTVTDEREGHASIAVEQVWKGPDLAPNVWLRDGGHGGSDGATEIGWAVSTRYLVLADAAFETNDCLAVPTSDVALSSLAPSSIREPHADGDAGDRPPVNGGLTAVIAGAVLVVGALAVHRRRRGADAPS